MRNIISAAIVAAGLVGLAASAQAAPVAGLQLGATTAESAIVHVRMSPRERMMRERMMRERARHHHMMRGHR